MQRILLSLKQVLSTTVLIICTIVFIAISGVFIGVQQPSYATTLEELKLVPPEFKPNADEKVNRAYEFDPGVGTLEEDRQQDYEKAVKESENLNTLEKAYEKNLKEEQGQNSQGSIVDKASNLIDKVTGK
ncbi:hypothetical protein H6G76_16750 [Nostoc sp. FACHB-152]|uniref:hypothetical protein n=1 Tax=unclassified Nostoc TaxID=2593658 RepID=UPI0016869ACA|nr:MULTISPECIES: hypothetical protein [unclassified Nostoc]MBD2448772.1 hypothetical protein [Nostoc sp. FACHB-152]MBD2467551.1 hypothetical protein [Nostoc sp. FACHB-145]